MSAIDEIIAHTESSDLYVLPEMFATGFCMDALAIAEQPEGAIFRWMQHTAHNRTAAIAGSVAVTADGKCYNRLYFVRPDGTYEYYDKRHLFTYSGENRHYAPGMRRVVTEFRGVRILLQVCYDLRFPVWSRNRRDYDMAIYVASWPDSRIAVWDLLLKARALENQCYVVGVNRVGSDPLCHYPGNSVVIDPYGRIAAACTPDTTATITFEPDMEKLATFRAKFPVLSDADSFILAE